MKDVDSLTESAAALARRGLSHGEVADELNVSRETASWLVERADGPNEDTAEGTGDADAAASAPSDGGPHDIHVDWSAVGRDSFRLSAVGSALADLLTGPGDAGITVGIEKAGVPLATVVSRELDTSLATYAPRKHQWEEGDIESYSGGFSRNFAGIDERACYVVDDTVTSGTTLGETVDAVRDAGGEPVACAVLADKRGIDDIDGVPVFSLLEVIRVGDGT